ncbi:MAG: DUF2264 domain-containing protein [Spirochaetales bacterium]|nr:DUF2264 domain-containing protein [Spirochaetales bacterium]
MYNNELKRNPLKTRADLNRALETLVKPLPDYLSHSNTWMLPASTGAHYTMNGAGFEGYSRPFWGIVPALAGGSASGEMDEYIRLCAQGMANGVDPEHPDYWGDTFDRDQKFVEMAVLGLSLLMAPEIFWERLDMTARRNLQVWLESANKHEYPPCNWLFFRVFVNMGLKQVCGGGSDEQIEADMRELDSYYQGDGWYSDGHTEQYDYYISFGMHFYGLLYAGLRKEEDLERAELYLKRAALFAKDFSGWFAPGGEAVAFGRSMTYRFAQCSFWSAAAFAGLEHYAHWLTPGVLKGLVLRHMRWWFQQPFFTERGCLTVGYAYPNLIMAEDYNGPGGPYWGLKSFFVLALGEDSSFWQAEEEPLPRLLPDLSVQKHPRFLVCRDTRGDVTILNAGQFARFDPRHNEQKYAKLAYSSRFSFSVPVGSRKLSEQSPDNSLMIWTPDNLWLHRGWTVNHQFTEQAVASDWLIRDGLMIRTILTWLDDRQIRVHIVSTDTELTWVEGGSACPIEEDRQLAGSYEADKAEVTGCGYYSAIQDLEPEDKGEPTGEVQNWLIKAEPNTNLVFTRTTIPVVMRKQTVRKALWISCASAGLESDRFKGEIRYEYSATGDLIFKTSGATRTIPAGWIVSD